MLEVIVQILTVSVSSFVAVTILPSIQPQNAALLRWVRIDSAAATANEQLRAEMFDCAIRDLVYRFVCHHHVSHKEQSELLSLLKRPGVLPFTVLLYPTLVKLSTVISLSSSGCRDTQHLFRRSLHLNTLIACLTVIMVVFPSSVGIALKCSSCWLFPMLNVLTFIKCWTLVQTSIADIGVLNLVMLHSDDDVE